MQEEINQKTITVCIKAGRVTANTLKAALRAVLRAREKHKQNVQRREAQYEHEDDVAVNRGKHSLRDLQDEGSELTNIEITDENIKSFERYDQTYDDLLRPNEDVRAVRERLSALQRKRGCFRQINTSDVIVLRRETGTICCFVDGVGKATLPKAKLSAPKSRMAQAESKIRTSPPS